MSLEILLVEDELLSVLIHKNVLRMCQFESPIVSCFDGQEALKYLDKSNESDLEYLILLDISMPVMNGWRFLEEIQKRPYKQKVSVVILSSSDKEEDKEMANNFPQVIHFIEKPMTLENCEHLKTLDIVKKYFQDS